MTPPTITKDPEMVLRPPFRYEPKKYDALYGMPGFSEGLLSTHFKLYEGYVANTNALASALSLPVKEGEGAEAATTEVRRRFGWEYNGMRLHEYYFENLGGDGLPDEKSNLYRRLCAQFGSFEAWKQDFSATGAMRGVGWAVLYEDLRSRSFFNVWVEEHNANHLCGGRPLLILDAFEHAYMKDYGVDRKKYIHNFFMNVNWDTVLVRSMGTAPGRA